MHVDLSKLVFPSTLAVTGQEIDISNLTPAQKEKYADLLGRILDIYESKNKNRLMVGLAGPTGSGKSVIAALFKNMASQIPISFRFETLGIDAFHYPNNYLLTHDVSGVPLKNFKGRFDTYDIEKLTHALLDFKSGAKVSFPEYSRVVHDPIEDAKTVTEEKVLLLVEGLWILCRTDGWEKVAECLDHSFFLNADKNAAKKFAVQRHVHGGRTAKDAENYYDSTDSANFDRVLETRGYADEVIESYFYQ